VRDRYKAVAIQLILLVLLAILAIDLAYQAFTR
jgi:hypothetical protein